MNITHFWPDSSDSQTIETWRGLLSLRQATFTGFAEVEAAKGFIRPGQPLSTSQGQEMLRILLFRVLEEMVESFEATDHDHVAEEAIDAINYLLSIPLLDPSLISPDKLAARLHNVTGILSQDPTLLNEPLTEGDLAKALQDFAGTMGDLMRNRAWMNQPQDLYFTGAPILTDTLCRWVARLYQVFRSWDQFYRFYIAKDRVLQFRLRSNY